MQRLFINALAICFLFTSCDPNNPDNEEDLLIQRVYSTLEISNSQVTNYSTVFGFDQTTIQVTEGSILYTSDVTEYSVYEGQTFYYTISVLCSPISTKIFECADAVIKTYQNDNLVYEQSTQFGYSSFENGIYIFCDPFAANNLFSDNLSLIAE